MSPQTGTPRTGPGTLIAALAAGAHIGVNFGDAFLQAVATVPAVWTVIAVSVAVVGARPQVSLAAWLGVLLSFGLTLLGPTFKLPDTTLAISPFWHIPNATSPEPDWWGLLWITQVIALFLLVGFARFRRRRPRALTIFFRPQTFLHGARHHAGRAARVSLRLPVHGR